MPAPEHAMYPVGAYETDVQSKAIELIAQYGEDAEVVAIMHAAELAAIGDADGLAVWDQIIACIESLSGAESPARN